jgi:hypothetical protein
MFILLIHLLFVSAQANVCNFVPKNDMSIPDVPHWGGGISKKEFKDVIEKISNYYKPIISAKGGVLSVNDLWQNSTVNASAEQENGKWILNMYGGLARHKLMTKDGFALVMCHELGHHLGGFPVYTSDSWASDEGQSDYFASMKCFRRVFENEDHDVVLSKLSVPAIVFEKCSLGFKSKKEISLCARESMAGLQVSHFLDDLRHFTSGDKPPFEITFDLPDTTEVPNTVHGHPGPQCRLDTYFAGAICPVSASDDFSRYDSTTGACAIEKNDTYGYRPRCWYSPKSN